MNLNVRDASKLLKVSEKTIYRWIDQGKLPALRIHDQYRFNRVELLEWATARRINVSPDIFTEPESAEPMPGLHAALQAGGIFYRLEGRSKAEVLRSVVEHMRLPEAVDREFLLRVLQAREELASTGVGDGIAIPHVRYPVVLHVAAPTLTLGFLEHPVDFGALDGRPVHALFVLASPTVRAHLHLLSHLGYTLRDPDFRAALKQQASREELLERLRTLEAALPGAAPDGAQDFSV
jgi:nitrogen PTS system EIIA component